MRDSTMLLPADEAARQLGLQPQTLAQWRHKGGGPAYVKLGNRVFYERAVLDAFIADHRLGSTAAESSPEAALRAAVRNADAARATAEAKLALLVSAVRDAIRSLDAALGEAERRR